MAKKDILKKKMLCSLCIGDDYLKREIELNGALGICSCCGEELEGYTFEKLADIVERVFETHFYRTADQPHTWQLTLLADKESDYEWEREGTPVVTLIADLVDISEESAKIIQSILEERHSDFDSAAMGEETEFSDESYYEERHIDDRAWQREWFAFEHSLKNENRFFNFSAEQVLGNIFNGIFKIQASSGKSVIVDAGPDTEFNTVCRARVCQSDEEIKRAISYPDREIGPPPSRIATAGRMNAQGISVFYGAQNVDTAIAEVRPPVGSQVVVAFFEIIRPLKLLNLDAFSSVVEKGSVFDPLFAGRLEKAAFLSTLCKRLARPVMPNEQSFEYLPTQCVADFLAGAHKPALDGIMFPSAQKPNSGMNIVLFHKSARVDERIVPDGATIEASTYTQYDDGYEREYSVIERLPNLQKSKKESEVSQTTLWLSDYPEKQRGGDTREVSLRIVLESICVQVIKSVSVTTEEYPVSRFEYGENESHMDF